VHPCRPCGACCAHLEVRFPDRECDLNGGRVPGVLTAPWIPHHVAMRRTSEDCCIALVGEVGRSTSCRIYDDRPSPCVEFSPSWEHGEPNPMCDESRAALGLEPLTPADW